MRGIENMGTLLCRLWGGFFLFTVVSCGGPASYTTPLVMQNQIIQSECREISETTPPPAEVSVKVVGSTMEVRHQNIYLPRGTLLGIEDRDGHQTWRKEQPYYYLDADTDYIVLRESARMVNSDTFCLYDLAVTIQRISGGEYTFYLFDYRGNLIPEATTRVRIR